MPSHTPKKSQTALQDSKQSPQVRAASFFDNFARLIKICNYYPTGHEVFTKTAALFLTQLKSLLPVGKKQLTISIRSDDCSIADIKIDELSKNAEDVRQLFFRIGIYQLDFNSTVSEIELQKFISLLMKWKMHSKGSKTFTFFSGADFPENIIVSQQRFAADAEKFNAGKTNTPTEKKVYSDIGQICRTLIDFGYSKNDVMRCRDFLMRVIKNGGTVATTSCSSAKNIDWNDIVNLLINFLNNYSSGNCGDDDKQSDLNTLSNIFESIDKENEDKSAQQAITMLMALFSNEADSQVQREKKNVKEKEESEKKEEDKNEFRISPSQAAEEQTKKERAKKNHSDEEKKEVIRLEKKTIEAFVIAKEFAPEMLERLSITDNSEELSILLQLLIATEERDKIPRLISRIQSFFNRKLSWREKEVLISGLAELAELRDFTYFYTTVKGVLETMRSFRAEPPLRFILTLHAALTTEQQKLAWVFLLNEAMLTGSENGENNKKNFVAAIHYIASLNQQVMNSMRSHLEQLSAFNSKKKELAEGVFIAVEVTNYPLYSFLLDTSIGKEVGLQIITILKKEPQDVFIAHIAPLIRIDNDEERNLLKQYLFYRPGNTLPRGVEKTGANLIAAELQKTNNGKTRNNNELVAMIEAIGKYGDKKLISLMENICNRKKIGLLYLWPTPCRKAAQTAIYSLKKR